jgi:hypothetical protein
MDQAASATAEALLEGQRPGAPPSHWSLVGRAPEPPGTPPSASPSSGVPVTSADFETDPKGTAVEAAGSVANAVLACNGAGV